MKEGWQIKKLNDVCTLDKSQGIHKNLPYVGMEDIESNTGRFIGPIKPQSVKSSTFKFTKEHVLYGRLRPYLNKVMLPDFVGHCSTEIFPIRPIPLLAREFLLYWLMMDATVGCINATCTGTRMPRANMNEVLKFNFPLPPLPEQKRIVAILDEAFSGITQAVAHAEKNLANARELFESYLNAVFIRKGEGWVETTLGKEIDLLTGFAFKSKGYTESNDSVKLLRGDNIVQGSFRWENVKKWPDEDTQLYSQYFLEDRDVVLAMDRTWIKAGLKYAQFSKSDLPCLLVQRVARLRAGANLDSRFLVYLIGSLEFTRYVLSIQTGLGVPHISGKQIKDFVFRRPSTAQQKIIATTLDDLAKKTQRLSVIYQQKLAALAELKQSILHKAFAGELTTEPAELKVLA